jgi:glucose/arabinose dehydrogenase
MQRGSTVAFLALMVIAGLAAACGTTSMPQGGPTAQPTQMPPGTPELAATETPQPEPSATSVPMATGSPTPQPTATESPPLPTSIGLELVADGLNSPVVLTTAGDDSGRLFIVDRVGIIRIITPAGELLAEPFLDVSDRVVPLRRDYDERGLLGLTFHPDYSKNGRLFVYYSAPLSNDAPAGWDNTAHISEFAVSAADPNRADPASERILLQVHEPEANHDGGQVLFGPDGYLYISLGDGGAANDVGVGHPPQGNGQDVTTLLGSVLRIDVNTGDPYAVPADNPFVGKDGRDEIYAYGFRNPFRMSFDVGGLHQLYVGDVGQNLWEEVDIVVNGGNYGWHIREGTHCFDPRDPNRSPEQCPDVGANGEPLIGPIIEYGHVSLPGGIGNTVIGGYIYRGNAIQGLQEAYVFGDWSSASGQAAGKILIAAPSSAEAQLWPIEVPRIATTDDGELHSYVLALGQDANLELYVMTTQALGPFGTSGKVWKIVPAP